MYINRVSVRCPRDISRVKGVQRHPLRNGWAHHPDALFHSLPATGATLGDYLTSTHTENSSYPSFNGKSMCTPHSGKRGKQALHAATDVTSSTATTDSSEAKEAADETSRDWEAEIEELMKLVQLLPTSVRSSLEEHPELLELLEVVMDLGRPPLARFPKGDFRLSNVPVTSEDLEFAIIQVGDFGGDNRAGIDRTLHRISCIRNRSGKIVGLTCRVGRAIRGSAKMVEDLVLSGASVLFLGRPGVGKTTAIREVSRTLADDLQKRVVIVDTSNEIGGDGDIPHSGIGRARRMQVAIPDEQHKVMIEAVENHMPEVIIIDEIGTEAECIAARTIAQRGVQLVATAHGNELENVIKNPLLADLVGGIQSVTLGDEEARRRGVQKSILERAAPPTFDVAVEMLERNKWRVHLDVAQAVDVILAGGQAGGQVRERVADGSILRYNYNNNITGVMRKPVKDMSRRYRGDSTNGNDSSSSGSSSAGLPLLPSPSSLYSTPTSSSRHTSYDMDAESSDGPVVPRTSSFVRAPAIPSASSNDSTEDDFGAAKVRSHRVQDKQVMIGTDASNAALRIFPYDLDMDKLWEVMTALDLSSKVYICSKVSEADAVLGLRTRVKQNAGLRQAAKESGVPIYAIKNSGTSSLVRAFRTLLGVDPSAGGVFARSGDEEAVVSDPSFGSPSLVSEELSLRAEVDIALVNKQRQQSLSPSSSSSPSPKLPYKAYAEDAALDEAVLAIEQIVRPLQQPVELLPRAEEVLKAQIELVMRYNLSHEVVGAGADTRLRVLPKPLEPASASSTASTASAL